MGAERYIQYTTCWSLYVLGCYCATAAATRAATEIQRVERREHDDTHTRDNRDRRRAAAGPSRALGTRTRVAVHLQVPGRNATRRPPVSVAVHCPLSQLSFCLSSRGTTLFSAGFFSFHATCSCG